MAIVTIMIVILIIILPFTPPGNSPLRKGARFFAPPVRGRSFQVAAGCSGVHLDADRILVPVPPLARRLQSETAAAGMLLV